MIVIFILFCYDVIIHQSMSYQTCVFFSNFEAMNANNPSTRPETIPMIMPVMVINLNG